MFRVREGHFDAKATAERKKGSVHEAQSILLLSYGIAQNNGHQGLQYLDKGSRRQLKILYRSGEKRLHSIRERDSQRSPGKDWVKSEGTNGRAETRLP